MRQFLSHFMILVMLIPALVCAPFMVENSAQASHEVHESQVSGDMPCPEMADQTDRSTDHGIMLFIDCTGVDLAPFDQSLTLEKPDFKVFKFLSGGHDITPAYSFTPLDQHQIRGPPEINLTSAANLPILLTTQRLRI